MQLKRCLQNTDPFVGCDLGWIRSWRRRRDSNPRNPFEVHFFSKEALSATQPLLPARWFVKRALDSGSTLFLKIVSGPGESPCGRSEIDEF